MILRDMVRRHKALLESTLEELREHTTNKPTLPLKARRAVRILDETLSTAIEAASKLNTELLAAEEGKQ